MKRHSAFTLFASLCVLLAAGAPAQESKAGRAPAGPVKGAETEPSLRAPDAGLRCAKELTLPWDG